MNTYRGKLRPLAVACLALPCSIASVNAQTGSNAIENIVVRGEKLQNIIDTDKALTPGAVTVLDSTELYERSVANLADSLRYVPGVWSASTSGSDSIFFSSRGSNLDATNYDMNGIKLLQDGLPVTAADGNNHNRIIDPLATRFASIARGANALKHGASTLGGAIDFITPTARNSDPLQAFLSTGSHGRQQARVTLGSEFNEALDAQITLEGKRWNGYREHNKAERSGAYANLGWQVTDTIETRFFVTYVNSDEELPGALTEAEVKADRDQANPSALTGHFQKDVVTRRIANKTSITFSNNRSLELGLSRETQALFHPIVDVRVDSDGPGPLAPTQVFSLLIDTDHEDTGAMARYRHSVGAHNLLLGINWGKNSVMGGNYTHDHANPTGVSTLIDNSAESVEAFVMDRWALNSEWTLVYGLQAVAAKRDVKSTGAATITVRNPSAHYDSINPRAGLIYQVNDQLSFYGNVGKLFEAPTNFELEDDARGNNATLDAMYGGVLEIGTRGQQSLGDNSEWHWDLSLYYADIRDEILSEDDPLAPGTSLTVNVDNTIHAGIEALLGGRFALASGARVEPRLSITVNHFRFDGDAGYGNNTLPAAPGYVVHGEVLYRRGNGFFAGPTFDVVDERYADFMNTYTIDSYSLLGFRAGLNRDNWQLFVDAKNLTDEEFIATHSVVNLANAGSRILNPGEPRSIYAGLQLRF
jgi:iron complex outermembrane recepter protein